MCRYSQYIKDVSLPAVLIFLGFVTFYTWDIRIAADMGWYMNSGLNIFLGKGYTDIDGSLIFNRGPVFPLMIAVSYWLLGVSSWSAFWVVRIFCIFNPIMIYFLGKKFFGKKIGFVAALLILTSYGMDYWSYRHIDAVWPFFILACNYFLYLGFEKVKLAFFGVSGVCLGLAILTKEVAIVFLPLPFLMFLWISDYRRKRILLKGVALSTSVAVITVMPWAFYLWENGALSLLMGRLGLLVGKDAFGFVHVNNIFSFSGLWESMVEKIGDVFTRLWRYYRTGRNSIHSNLMLAPGLVISWVFAIVMAIKGDKRAKIFVLNFILFSPVLFFVAKRDMRLGQSIFVLLISYILLVVLASWLVERVSSILIDTPRFKSCLFSVVILTLLALQVFGSQEKDLGYKNFISGSYFSKLLNEEISGRNVCNPFGMKEFAAVIAEVQAIADAGDAVMVDWYTHARATYFQMAGERLVACMPFIWCLQNRTLFGERLTGKNEKPLWISSNYIPLDPQYIVFMLFESHLMEVVREKDIKYVLLTPRLSQLNDYFMVSSSFEEVETSFSKGKRSRLYRVIGPDRSGRSVETVFTGTFQRTMRKLKSEDPKKYEVFREKYIYGIAGIPPDRFAELEVE